MVYKLRKLRIAEIILAIRSFVIMGGGINEKIKKLRKLEKYRAEPEMQPYYTKPCKACNRQIENRVQTV